MSRPNQHPITVTATINAKDEEFLQRATVALDMSRAEIVRLALRQFLERTPITEAQAIQRRGVL